MIAISGIRRVQAADMPVRQAVLAADEHLPEAIPSCRSSISSRSRRLGFRPRRLLRRIGIRSVAHPLALFVGLHPRAQPLTVTGPLPATT